MSFEQAVERVLKLEGGYVDHSADKGGPTRFGITQKTAREYGYDGDMRELPKEIAKEIYKHRYWQNYDLDKIDHEQLAGKVFSFGINAGTHTAVKALQRAYNLLTNSEIAEDGLVGPETLQAVNNYDKTDRLLDCLKAIQAEYYLDIVRGNPGQNVFLAGWLNRVFE